METLVVVGTGHAANALVSGLARHGYQGRVVMVGDETHPPYNRPPLSKKFLVEEMQATELYFRGREQFSKSGIELHLNNGAVALNSRDRTLKLASGETLSYDWLVLATGASPRRLPEDLDRSGGRVRVLRNIDDAARLKADLGEAQDVVIIGGGYVGLEVAASAAQLGKHVTVVEAASRVLARVAVPELAAIVQRVHEGHGVSFRLDSTVTLVSEGSHGLEVTLAGGERLTAGLVLCAIGAVPNTALAEAAGLVVKRGIVTDFECKTSDHRVFAVGDCAAFVRDGDLIQLESVQNASDQAEIVARRLCGLEAAYAPLPWFWSDQYDLRLQSVGLAKRADGSVLRSKDNSHTIWHHRDGCIIALDTVNAPRDHMMARRLMGRGEISLEALHQVEFDLSRLMVTAG